MQRRGLTSEVPEAKAALEAGTLSLSNASRLQSFFRQEKKQGQRRTAEQKADLILEVIKAPSESSLLQKGLQKEGLRVHQEIGNSAGISQRAMELKLAELAPQVQLVSEKARLETLERAVRVCLDQRSLRRSTMH